MRLKTSLAIALSSLLLGCQSTYQIDEEYRSKLKIPASWQYQHTSGPVKPSWLGQITEPQVHQLVTTALSSNLALLQLALEIEVAKQQLVVSGSALWPTLDISLDSVRRKSSSNTFSTEHALDLKVGYELDLWGKLSEEERQANLTVMASLANYQQQTHNLVADVVISWFAVIEGQTQQQLLNERLAVVEQNLDIIESGYRQGLNSALDVYLARTELNNEQAKLAQQKSVVETRVRKLERLVGEYPSGLLTVDAPLPLLDSTLSTGLPSTLVSRKPSLLASWYQLLAQDAALAFAHKQRFPSLKLSASYGPSGEQLDDVLSFSAAGWSLLSSISAPLFNAGKLAAREEIARTQLKSLELQYLNNLQDAFSDVENGISAEVALKKRYQETLIAEKNAQLAEQLSFEQYQKGLVSYTTVLDAQKRAFDAKSSLISIKNELIKNRVELHLALGGDFQQTEPKDVNNDIG
ncbi:TolC family protein [Pseudoalteromonas obscura]|uniref:TolC family protein n=1 Tax=Pseudoalteromonas obscura TaxID=3048491 RepID=A0ABT7EJR7_9GAMM|nr:TolC family protein [Pseudoalteromonas sp. P94(2023)]MDK2595287.1 TolC family protein [Pseudoalteromonas sp. P94(2023)]